MLEPFYLTAQSLHCDLDLWPFDPKVHRAHTWLMERLHVKFHEDRCKGEAFMRLKPFYLTARLQTDGQTDGRTGWFQYTPLNSLRGYNYVQIYILLVYFTFDWAFIFKNNWYFGKEISISFSYYNPCGVFYLKPDKGIIFIFVATAIPEF